MKHKHLFVAGTFDGLHKGHIALLTKAFASGRRVTVGLTSDEFVRKFKDAISDKQEATRKKKNSSSDFTYHLSLITYRPIRSYQERRKKLEQWLIGKHWQSRSTIVPIHDPYEPATSDDSVDALVVSTETRKRGEEINIRRKQHGLSELALIEVPMVNARDGKPISSTRLRGGQIDREGNLILPDNLRPELQMPLGKLLVGKAIEKAIAKSYKRIVITVGDVTTKAFVDGGRLPDLSIIDHRVGRKPYRELTFTPLKVRPLKVKSGPGYISRAALDAINKLSHHLGKPSNITRSLVTAWSLIVVDGEEDLLALPAITEAPIGSLVYYGQPGQGMVEVEVTDLKKKRIGSLLKKFI